MDLSNELRKIVLAGVGAAALSVDNAKKITDELIKKGEMTVEHGKALNEELKQTLSQKPENVDQVYSQIEKLSPEERAQLIEKLNQTPQE